MFKTICTAFLLLASSIAFAGQVNINAADAETLATLKGVGPSKAAAIIAYRDTHGAFNSAQDLVLVRGIGEKTLELNEETISVVEQE